MRPKLLMRIGETQVVVPVGESLPPEPVRVVASEVSTGEISRLYVDEGMSTREVAARLRVTRWVVVMRLRERGVALRERDEAAGLARFLRDARASEGNAGRCQWPGCADARSVGAGVCDRHAEIAFTRDGSRCRWPDCTQSVSRVGGACYGHLKRARGLIAS